MPCAALHAPAAAFILAPTQPPRDAMRSPRHCFLHPARHLFAPTPLYLHPRLARNDASTSTEPPLLRSAQRQRDADAPGFHARPPPTRTLPHNASAVLPLPSLWPLPNFLVCTRPHGASKRKPAALPLVSHPPRPLVCASPTATFAAPLHDANASAPALTHAERCK
ncbi:hypothetical protein B0H13DRAFT_2383721 [Mycena leptocephala]|nr:hypothetical protein B0H13DRAFT_2383721 [Mycena leptocephala]